MAQVTYILGLNAYHGDASAVLLADGRMVAAVEEERINRVKHSAGFPANAVRFCLARAGIRITDVAHVGISRVPSAHLINKMTFVLYSKLMFTRQGLDRLRSVEKIRNVKTVLAEVTGENESDLRMEFHNVEHHVAHMASAFLVSPFEEAALFSADGFGDFCSTMLGRGSGKAIERIDAVMFPHSLGLFYTGMTQYLGFHNYGDEGKVMGLAPYGEARYFDDMVEIARPEGAGSFLLNLDYFTHHTLGVEMSWDESVPQIGRVYSDKLIERLGPPREPGGEITQRHRDLAASLQKCLEFHLYRILNRLHDQTHLTRLCLAGGVAYNSVANSGIPRNTPFSEIFIQPAAGDSGTALGVAYYIWNTVLGRSRDYVMNDVYLGPDYDEGALERAIRSFGATFRRYENIEDQAAELLSRGKIVGWFQGRMEFGPRALGNRSILADPRFNEVKDILNRRIKHRESFRPFAPAVLEEYVDEYFEDASPSRFMLMVFKVRPEKRPSIPAIEHVDHTGRIQSVSRENNLRFWNLIEAFRGRTRIPLVLNTSFNENEPIVCSPEDALDCFATTQMDALALGNFLVTR